MRISEIIKPAKTIDYRLYYIIYVRVPWQLVYRPFVGYSVV